ncbi:hypothetical protein OHT61_21040 [Streptomyces sp. NBC_00178]|uniref:hypothetical protein n=1 Tax=Streptomyces sp. NBC_00178 TaxID=2975672 RepID=UPI002E2A2D40|nr:hypothetical protein [Streptomyces sp. NBC_00178]
MSPKKKTLRLAVPAVLAATAVVGLTVPAFADLPGAGSGWQPVTYSGGQIQSSTTEGEARDELSNVLHAWHAADNDNLWISLNNGPALQLPATAGSPDHAQSSAAPTVIWTKDGGRGNFRIFHTGKDGHIYQHRIQLTTSYQLPAALPNATEITNNARTNTSQPVAAAALPNNSYMLAWNSQSSDDIWTMYYDAATGKFNPAAAVPNARSKDAPTLAAQVDDGNDPAPWNQVVLAFEGTDFNMYMSRQQYGTSTWTNPKKVGPYTTHSPSVALTDNGYGVITFRDYDGTVGNYQINRHGDVMGSSKDASYGWTNSAPLATSSGPLVYNVITGGGGGYSGVVWKQAADFRGLPTPAAPQW